MIIVSLERPSDTYKCRCLVVCSGRMEHWTQLQAFTTDKFDFLRCRHKHTKLCVNTIIKLVYIVHTVGWNYRKKIGFPVCRKSKFHPPSKHRKRGKSPRASPSPHQISLEQRSACFVANYYPTGWGGWFVWWQNGFLDHRVAVFRRNKASFLLGRH